MWGQIVQGIKRSLRELDQVWRSCRQKYPLYNYPFHGLNWVLLDGKRVIAMCYTNPGGFGKAKRSCTRKSRIISSAINKDPRDG